MPIPFTCPHCGASTSVADQYAGQTGPCGSCGAAITVPSRAEALGVAFMEALASGTPAIGSNVGGIPEVLDQGRAGWLVDAKHALSIRAAIVEAVTNANVRAM